MFLDAKLINFGVFEILNIQIEDFNILGHDPRMLKSLNEVFESQNFEPKAFNVLGSCHWMLTSLISMFWISKAPNLKFSHAGT